MKKKDIEAMSGKTDERNQGDWKSRYTDKAVCVRQKEEAAYLLILVVISFIVLLLNHIGVFERWFCLSDVRQLIFSKMLTCAMCGLLGGTIFDMKWFYKSIAHGFWNIDRIYWRVFSPIISMSFAFGLACILSDNVIITGNGFSAASLGFLAGYFSDEAVGKMAEVAKVLFNANNKSDDEVKKNALKDTGESE